MNRKIKIGRYVDLTSDAGFKAVFADRENKDLLIQLLNSFLPEDEKIAEMDYYADREHSGVSIDNKYVRLDLRCKDQQGRDFIVEVQKELNDFFYLRALSYASLIFNSNLEIGDDMYETLQPVYLISFICQPLKEPEFQGLNDVVLWYQMCEKNYKCFAPNGINIIFANIFRAADDFSECKNETEEWCHIFRNIGKYKNEPEAIGDGKFVHLAKAAEIANYDKEKKIQYKRDVMNELDYLANLRQKYKDGRKEGILEMAKSFLSNGVDIEVVMKSTGLSRDEVLTLR